MSIDEYRCVGGVKFYWTEERSDAIRDFMETYQDNGFEAACMVIKNNKARDYILEANADEWLTEEQRIYLKMLDL